MRKKTSTDIDDMIITDDKNEIDIYKYSDVVDRLVAERKKLKKIIEELELENEELKKQEIRIPKHFFYILIGIVFYLFYIIRNDNVIIKNELNYIKEEITKIRILRINDFKQKYFNINQKEVNKW